jgi:hypothetical protein
MSGPSPEAIQRALEALAAELHKRNPAVAYKPSTPGGNEPGRDIGRLGSGERRQDVDARHE